MKTAPLSGYNTKQISIDVTNANIGYIYFYVMINGYYGKGHITKRAFPNTLGTELRITLKIYLNVEDDDTKKRNVISPDNY